MTNVNESLQHLFTDGEKPFLLGAELVTTRGIILQEDSRKISGFAEALCEDDRLDWISITDNAGGNPMLSPDHLGRKVLEAGKHPIIHITCKDRNRNALESQAWQYASEGLDNLLVLTGDYPVNGFNGIAQPVFDLDSVGLTQMLNDLNNGLKIRGRRPNTYLNLNSTDFFLGCAVSPFKLTEAEQYMQYAKLRMKVEAGAKFIIPQLGYDMRKSHELITWLKQNGLNIPVIGNIYRLTAGVARIFNKGLIPGCVVSDDLLARIDKEKKSDDKGKSFFIDLAARQYAAFRLLGYRGAYIGGVEKIEDFSAIVDKAEEYKDAEWDDIKEGLINPQKSEFHMYERLEDGPLAGLADGSRPAPMLSTTRPRPSECRKRDKEEVTGLYRFSRVLHNLVFDYEAPLFHTMRKLFMFLEKHTKLDAASYFNERMWKAALFECRECGDCSLADITYLCPQSQCAKNERNGPCGGSLADACEVTKNGKECIWVRAYHRKRAYGEDPASLLDRPPVIKNNDLSGTSGWANCFLLRDHNAFLRKQLPKNDK